MENQIRHLDNMPELSRTIANTKRNTVNIWIPWHHPGGGGGVLPEKVGGGVRPASQNPYPIYDQNLRYSLPYLWPDQKFET